jgi:hypothetical protein
MARNDIQKALEIIRKSGEVRDREFLDLLNRGWKLRELAVYYEISRQRAQQIAQRLRRSNGTKRKAS